MADYGDNFDDLLALPRSELAEAAHMLVSKAAPEYVYNHSIRSYLFAKAAARTEGLRGGDDFDDEQVFLSCVLHDLGATDFANGDQRFELDGADAAAAFLRSHDVEETRIKEVWTAIALHTSAGLAHRFGVVEAITQRGIVIDLLGYEKDMLPAGFAERVHSAWPRHNLSYALTVAIGRQVADNPAKGGPLTFPGQVHQLLYAPEQPMTWLDAVASGEWGDKPTSEFRAVPRSARASNLGMPPVPRYLP